MSENQEKIVIRGARTHNLKNIQIDLPRNKLIVITRTFPVPGSPRLLSTPFMRKDSAVMSNRSRPTPASFCSLWKNLMWI